MQTKSALALATTGFSPWEFNIALENRPCIDGLPSKHCQFPWQCQITTEFTLARLEAERFCHKDGTFSAAALGVRLLRTAWGSATDGEETLQS